MTISRLAHDRMNTRERFKAIMNFQRVDRFPAIESYWWWDKTIARWYEEGLPKHLKDHSRIAAHLGLDTHRIFWITPASRLVHPPGRSRFEGVVDNAEQYNELVKPVFDGPTINPDDIRPFAKEQQSGDFFLWLQIDGFFWFPRAVLGIERHLLAFYDQPELLHQINTDLTDYTLRLFDELLKICVPDVLTFAEDMSYNHGPMLSKECFDEFLAPYYNKVVPVLKDHGVLPFVDSDGDIQPLIPWLESVGIEGITPLERMAGNDINEIRKLHPRFKILGGFDKMVMHLGERAIRQEFERILPVMKSGGYIPSVDHQTPPGVSLQDYHLYVSVLREFCEKAAQ